MNRNPKKVRDLRESIGKKESELAALKTELSAQKRLTPVGYKLIGAGARVKEGALGYEPHHGHWSKAGNSVGCELNDQGYVTGITHRGWLYANLID